MHTYIQQETWNQLLSKATRYVNNTSEYALRDINPGGCYSAVWTRDAAYILKDQFLSGNTRTALEQILSIWIHQIGGIKEKIVYGRGSPGTNFTPMAANIEINKNFEHALPTTIYQNFSEVYGRNPDIDSTALMISTTSWILSKLLKKRRETYLNDNDVGLLHRLVVSSTDFLSHVIDFAVPRMLYAVEYLARRDIDNDGLLEQDQNEDWMDTALRDGKVVYSQSSWILALKNLSILMFFLGRDSEAQRLKKLTDDSILSIERILWSHNDACYIDLQKDQYISDVPNRTLTQDVSLYLVAVTENLNDNYESSIASPLQESEQKKEHLHLSRIYQRAIKTLEALRKRIWKNEWPLVTEIELRKTGPWVLKPNQYHNHTFWPWITGIEMLARSRFNRIEECNILLSKLASEWTPHTQSFYEWIDPITSQGNGAFPFRTGISAIRIAISDILQTDKI